MTGMLLSSLFLKVTGGCWLGFLTWWLFFLGNLVLIAYYQYRFVFLFHGITFSFLVRAFLLELQWRH